MGKRLTLTDQVLEKLRRDLINWEYNVNDVITEAEISKKYEVSKTPAREALTLLWVEGLLEKVPRKGYFVKSVSLIELQSLFQFRLILEKASVELVIRYATDQELETIKEISKLRIEEEDQQVFRKYNELNYKFHMAIVNLTRNPHLISSLGSTLNQLSRALVLDWKSADTNRLLAAHEDMAAALMERDIEKAHACVLRESSFAESRIFQQEYGLR